MGTKRFLLALFFVFLICEPTVQGYSQATKFNSLKLDLVNNIQLKEGVSQIIDTLLGGYVGDYRNYIPNIISIIVDKLSVSQAELFASPYALQVTEKINVALSDASMQPTISSFHDALRAAEQWYKSSPIGQTIENLFSSIVPKSSENKPAATAADATNKSVPVVKPVPSTNNNKSTQNKKVIVETKSDISFMEIGVDVDLNGIKFVDPQECSTSYHGCTNISCPIGSKAHLCTDTALYCSTCGAGKYDPRPNITTPCNYCADCSAGTFSKPGSATCSSDCGIMCSSPSLADRTTCTSSDAVKCYCPAGTYGPETNFGYSASATACQACGPSQYQEEPMKSKCESCGTCPTGSEQVSPCTSTQNTRCECSPGYAGVSGLFSAISSNVCTVCPSGFYTAIGGQQSCSHCPTNQASSPGSTSCSCAAGYRLDESGCSACPIGSYKSDVSNSPSCISCPSTMTTLVQGATSSDQCVCIPGYYMTSSGTCQPCPVSTYKADAGNNVCTACPDNSSGPGGATSISSCLCSKGYFTNGLACSICETGTFASSSGSQICSTCPAHSSSDPGSSRCVCNPGYTGDAHLFPGCTACPTGTFKSISGSQECSSCPDGQFSTSSVSPLCVCDVGYELFNSVCKPCDKGFYSSAASNLPCTSCPAQATTVGTGSSSASQCVCAEGYQASSTGSCVECVSGTFSKSINSVCQPCSSCPNFSDPVSTCRLNLDTTCQCRSGYKRSDGVTGAFGASSLVTCASCGENQFLSGGTTCLSCTSCPLNSVVKKECSSTAQRQCYCVEGFKSTNGNGLFDAGSSSCQVCPSGSFAATSQSAECTPHTQCPSGFVTIPGTSTTDSQCVCPVGKILSTSGTACVDCPTGTFNSRNGGPCVKHTVCERGFTQKSGTGSTSTDVTCVCAKGRYIGSDQFCKACDKNYYQPNENSWSCLSCQPSSCEGCVGTCATATTGSTACECVPGSTTPTTPDSPDSPMSPWKIAATVLGCLFGLFFVVIFGLWLKSMISKS